MQNEKIRNALVGLVAILMIFLQTIVSEKAKCKQTVLFAYTLRNLLGV